VYKEIPIILGVHRNTYHLVMVDLAMLYYFVCYVFRAMLGVLTHQM